MSPRSFLNSSPRMGRALGPALGGALAAWTIAMLLACGVDTGSSSGERTPGGSTNVDPTRRDTVRDDAGTLLVVGRDGGTIRVFDDAGMFNPSAAALSAIAVDERDETAYVAQSFPTRADRKDLDGGVLPDDLSVKTLYAVRVGATEAVGIMRLDGFQDTRVLFPSVGVMLATNRATPSTTSLVSCETRLALWTVGATSFPRTRLSATCLNVDALSPSRRLATSYYGDEDHLRALGLVDPSTLFFAPLDGISADGEVEGAAWLHQRDGLVTVASRSGSYRVDLWDLSAIASANFSPASTPIHATRESGASFSIDTTTEGRPSALRISPDDRLAALSSTYNSAGIRFAGEAPPVPSLHLIDLSSGAQREVAGVVGPVGFSPDNSTVVAWRSTRDEGSSAPLLDGGRRPSGAALVFIDRVTFARTEVALPVSDPLLLFVTRTGHRVIVSVLAPQGELLLYDMQMGRVSGAARPVPAFDHFVSRDDGRELWLADDGLWRVSLLDDSIERVAIGWDPDQINLLPHSDLLVLSRPFENAISFWSPTARATQRTVRLPVPPRPGP